MNRITLTGRWTTDPVLRKTQSDKAVMSCTLAVARQENREQTDFINIVAWSQLAENTARYTHKGSQVGIDGRLQMRKYTAKNGEKRTTFEVYASGIDFLDSKPKTAQEPAKAQNQPVETEWSEGIDVDPDDLPF